MLFTFIIRGESLIMENFSPLNLQQGVPCKGLAQPPLLQQDQFVLVKTHVPQRRLMRCRSSKIRGI